MTFVRAAVLSALLPAFSSSVAPLLCQAPTELAQIPIYAGASRQPDREAEEAPSGLQGRTTRVYRVRTPIEDVVRFYQQRLQAQELRTDADRARTAAAAEQLAPGRATAVVLQLDRSEDTKRVTSATFDWEYRPNADRHLQFDLSLEDVEPEEGQESSPHQTEIVIQVQDDGPVAAEEEPKAQAPAAPMAAPTEGDLGVPLYPGARFDGRMSGQMSASDEEANYYVYTSADTPQQVATFYQTRTGKKGLTTEGGVLIAVRGEGLFPELGITVQPNAGTYPPSVKTMLTIRKRR